MNVKRLLATTLTPIVLTVGIACPSSSHAAAVALQQATATFSQTIGSPTDLLVGNAIDGSINATTGWAIAQNDAVTTNPETAVFETVTNAGFLGGSVITFKLTQIYGSSVQHTLGHFRLSVTTDDRSLFADGLASGGDVTANWVVLDPSTAVSSNGATLAELGDFSILASGTSPNTDIYTITAPTSLTGITGVRLETLADATLPGSGPGRAPSNGNFVLSEFEMDITNVPEPASALLLLLSGAALGLRRRALRTTARSA